jgi:hypothetical protein
MTKSTLIDLPVSNQAPSHNVPTTPPYSPIDAESNGTSLATVAQSVALAVVEAPSIEPVHSAAMTQSTLIITLVGNHTPSHNVPAIVPCSPNDAESNGTSLATVAQRVALAESDAPPTSTPYSTAMPRIELIDLPVSNQTPSHNVPTIVLYSPIDAESNGTSLAAVAQSVALAVVEAPSIAVDHSTAIASCTLIIT